MTTIDARAPEGGRPVSEMQERIARAIYEGRNGPRCKSWTQQPAAHRAPYMVDALAAMKAMREPTPEMEKAGDDFIDFGSDFTETWRAAMDAEISLAEGGKDA